MNFLPVVERELRAAARLRSTYWTRFTVALVGIALCSWMLFSLRFLMTPHEAGRQLFMVLAGLAFLHCLLAGTQTTADCLSSEKRNGTLGLLFLTDLKGYDIVAGKLAATSLNAVYSLLAILPVMALPLLMGGVSGGGFWRVALALLNTMFFSLAAGMFVSALSRTERGAVMGTVGLTLGVTAGLPVSVGLWKEITGKTLPDVLAQCLVFSSPAYAFGRALESIAIPRGSMEFVWSSLVVHGLGWLFLILAARLAPRMWTDRVAGASGGWQRLLDRWRYGDSITRPQRRVRLLAINPITWLSARNRMRAWSVWLLLIIIAAGWVWGYAKLAGDWLMAPMAITFAIFMHGFLKFAVSGEACRRFAEDRDLGALELLLSTPLRVKDLLGGQLRALMRQFSGPVMVVLVADLLLLLAATGSAVASRSNLSAEETRQLGETFLAGVVVFLADLYTFGWLGMWLGLRAPSYTRAWWSAIGLVMFVPWGVFIGVVFTYGAMTQFRHEPNFEAVLGFWLTLCLVNNALLTLWAMHSLTSKLREEAARRFQPGGKRRWWQFFTSGAD